MESKKELLATQSDLITDAEKTKANKENSSELIKIKHIEKTPFTIINTVDNEKWFIAMGNARLTEYKNSLEECEEMIIEKSWELIMSMCSRIVDITLTIKNENNA